MTLITKFSDFNIFCEYAEIPFGYFWQGKYFHTWALNKDQRRWIKLILSFLKIDTDARKIAEYYATWLDFQKVFFKKQNLLWKLDEIAQKQLANESSLNIVITGLGSLTGCGKSWSALALCMRWSPIDEQGRTLFYPKKILMQESELDKVIGFKKAFYVLDDPALSTIGTGVNRLKERLSNLMRIASRKAQTSLLICSAIDIFKNNKLSLDGIHFYIEVFGYNERVDHALGMLYDRFFTPLGWVFIPSPTQKQIIVWNPEIKEKEEKKIILWDEINKREYTPRQLVNYYETQMKKGYVEETINDEYNSPLGNYIKKILRMQEFQEFVNNPNNIKKTLIESWIIINGGVKLTNKEYSIISNMIYARLKGQIRKEQLIISDKDNKEFIPTFRDKNFEFNLIENITLDNEEGRKYFQDMFCDEAKKEVLKVSDSFQELLTKTWKALQGYYVHRLKYRDLVEEGFVSSIYMFNKLHKQARQAFIGYLDEFAFSKYRSQYDWVGGNDPGLADFIDKKNKKVVSKKFRFDANFVPKKDDLSKGEIGYLEKDGWTIFLVVTEGYKRSLKTYRVVIS